MSIDLIVIGAGPAGTAAAITASRLGRSVTVVDRATFPRDKICGDGLTAGALRQLDWLGLQPDSVASWKSVADAHIQGPSGARIHLPLPRTGGQFTAIATRLDLDAALVELARKHGVTIVEGAEVTSVIDAGTDEVQVETTKGSLSAPWVIAADGMWSPTRKLLGLAEPGYRGEWHAFRQYVTNVSDRAASEIYVTFEPDFLPGYFWSFPLPDGRANIGFGISREERHTVRDMKWLWPDLLARPHIREWLGPDAEFEGSHRAWPIPCRIGELSTGAGRVMFVGDAAAACDVLTGEGIGQALLSGRLAAEQANSNWGEPPNVQRSYRRAIDRGLVADHKMSHFLTRAVRHRKGVRIALWLCGLTPWTRRNFARWLFEDYPRALLFTPKRWHRQMFTGPGAYRSG